MFLGCYLFKVKYEPREPRPLVPRDARGGAKTKIRTKAQDRHCTLCPSRLSHVPHEKLRPYGAYFRFRLEPRAQVAQITPKPSTSSRSLFTAGLPRRRAACTAGRGDRAPAFRFHAPRLARWLCTWAAPGCSQRQWDRRLWRRPARAPGQWLGAQWPTLPLGVSSRPEPPRAARRAWRRRRSRSEALLSGEFDHAPLRTASVKPRSAQPPAHSAVKGRPPRNSWSVARAASCVEGCASASAPPPAVPS